MFPKLKEMIEAEQTRKEQLAREERRRARALEFARTYLDSGVSANEPEEGPFMMPSWGIFKHDPRVQAVLAEGDYTIPFTEERYEEIEDVIAEGVIKYNIRARRDLARMHGLCLLPGENEEETDENIIKPFLERATTIFYSDWPGSYKCMSYKTISEILHLALAYSNPEREPPEWIYLLLGFTPDILAGKIVRELLRVAGAPENYTREQMERDYEKKLVCTCRKPNFEQPTYLVQLVSILARAFLLSVDENFLSPCSQIEHIRYERTWDKPSGADRWSDGCLKGGSSVDLTSFPS